MAPEISDYKHVIEQSDSPIVSRFSRPNPLLDCLRINSPLAKLLTVVLYYLVACLWYCNVEQFRIFEAIYFTTVTFTSVGYGFFHPSVDNWRSQLFTIFFILVGCSVIISILNDFSQFYLVGAQDEFIRRYIQARKIDAVSAKQMNAYKINFSIALLITALISGSVFFYGNEPDWTFVGSVYWVVCTMTTVGFGDLTITKESTRIFNMFLILATVMCYSLLVNNILGQWVESVTNRNADSGGGDTGDAEAPGGKTGTAPRHVQATFDQHWADGVMDDVEAGGAVSHYRLLLEALIHMGRLDREAHVAPIMRVSRESVAFYCHAC